MPGQKPTKLRKTPKLWLLEECPLRTHNRDITKATTKAKEIGDEKE